MSIGSWRALLKFDENPLVNSVYSVKIPHVQHVSSVLLAIVLISFSVAVGSAEAKVFPKPDPTAGLMSCHVFMGRRDDFFDFEYVQKMWCEMNTLDALNRERAKYAAVFGPWFERYKVTKDRHGMYEELRNFSEPERTPMRHGHDLQVAYNTWLCEHHDYWIRLYKVTDPGNEETFDKHLARQWVPLGGYTRKTSLPFGPACAGSIPDWRSPEMKAEDEAMMAAADKVRCGGKPCKKGQKGKAN